MGWNNPLPTLADGGTPTAAQFNQYRENMNWLRSPPKAAFEYSGTADLTTTSLTWGTISSSFATAIVTTGEDVLVLFSATLDNLDIDISLDGTRLCSSGTAGSASLRGDAVGVFVNGYNLPVLYDNLAAGTHTFAVQWKATAGTGTIFAGYQPRFYVRAL